jgi:hypothetical protein
MITRMQRAIRARGGNADTCQSLVYRLDILIHNCSSSKAHINSG